MKILDKYIEEITNNPNLTKKMQDVFKKCLENTFLTTIKKTDRDDIFMVTGDIPAMWLRDSSAQIRPFLYMQKDEELDNIIKGVIKRQIFCINIDPYANAFNELPTGDAWHKLDITKWNDYVWERKFEIDSLCYPLDLAFLYFQKTKNSEIFNEEFHHALTSIIDLFIIEQNHDTLSDYSFIRPNAWAESDTLPNNGKGNKTKYTGMVFSGFRPSDDSCLYGYLVPANMFIVQVLKKMKIICQKFLNDEILLQKMQKLQKEIENGIENHAKVIIDNKEVYAYEVDGFGNYLFMDDANVPSLLSIPYLGYKNKEDQIYQNTRNLILSNKNEYYYEGKIAKGIGSPHTPKNYIWHISLAIQGLTASKNEQFKILELMCQTDANTNLMHEGFDCDDATKYTREWFSWANSMYCELVLKYLDYQLQGENNE